MGWGRRPAALQAGAVRYRAGRGRQQPRVHPAGLRGGAAREQPQEHRHTAATGGQGGMMGGWRDGWRDG